MIKFDNILGDGIGYLELQDNMGTDADIVSSARTSYMGSSKGAEADKKLLFYMLKHKHTSPFEQAQIRVRVKAPIFVVRQWFRHRFWSVNEQSRRYTSSNIEFYLPTKWRQQDTKNKQASIGVLDNSEEINDEYIELLRHSVHVYDEMIDNGIAREMARMVLPVSLYTTFIGSIDLLNLMRFIQTRTGRDERGVTHAQHEIVVYGEALKTIMNILYPWTAEAFDKYGI